MENSAEANQLLRSFPLLLIPIGEPIRNFVLCVDTPMSGRKFVGVVPKAVQKRILDLYEQCKAWSVKWCSNSIYANDSVMWIEVIPECDSEELFTKEDEAVPLLHERYMVN